MTIREQLARNLGYYRKRAGYTQKIAAEKLGTKLTTMSSWERGVSQPDADMLVSIAMLYRVPLSDLCGMDYDTSITVEERELIYAFRNHPEVQDAVRKLLDVREKKDNSISKKA